MDATLMKVWILYYRYYDNSGFGVLRAYLDHDRAQEDMCLLSISEDGKGYFLEQLPVTGPLCLRSSIKGESMDCIEALAESWASIQRAYIFQICEWLDAARRGGRTEEYRR